MKKAILLFCLLCALFCNAQQPVQSGTWVIWNNELWLKNGSDSTLYGTHELAPYLVNIFSVLSTKQAANGNGSGLTGLTKSQVGLSNVDNTSDASKPVSTAMQSALDLKANLASPTFTGTVSGITAAMVGLGNVNNTSDANKPVSTATQSALDGKQATLVSGTNIKTINGATVLGSGDLVVTGSGAAWGSITGTLSNQTDLQSALDAKQNSLGFTAVPNTRTVNGQALSSDVTIATITGNAGTATSLQTARKINGVNFDGTGDIYTDPDLLAYDALGSTVKAETVGQKLFFSNTSTALVDGQIKYTAIYLPKGATLTGLKFYVRVLGVYTGDNNNRVGLYSYSGGTLTLVASSANNATLWTGAANAALNVNFTSTYVAAPGLYFAAFIYNQSAQTTAPSLASGVALNNGAMGSTAFGFTNSAKLYGTSTGTDLPASIAMTSITASSIPSWVAIY